MNKLIAILIALLMLVGMGQALLIYIILPNGEYLLFEGQELQERVTSTGEVVHSYLTSNNTYIKFDQAGNTTRYVDLSLADLNITPAPTKVGPQQVKNKTHVVVTAPPGYTIKVGPGP